MSLPVLQQLWLSGCTGCQCSRAAAGHLLAQIAPALYQAVLPSSPQAWFSSSSASTSAAAATPAAAATSPQKQKKQQQQQQQPPTKQLSEKELAKLRAARQAQREAFDKQVQIAKQQYQSSRLQDFYTQHLSRELMLKLNVPSCNRLPKIKSVALAISAKDLFGRRYAEKWEMLLPALALEYITGKPAEFVHSQVKYYRSRNAVTAVKVDLNNVEGLDFLQKLIYIVLPSQNAFSGISTKSLDRNGNLHFRLPKMINFPDFEEQFEVFENLESLHVSINMANVKDRRGRSQLLLTGLQLPMLARKGGPTDLESEKIGGETEESDFGLVSDEEGEGEPTESA